MEFGDSSEDEDVGKVRVKFVTKIPSIRVTETPIAVPETLQRYGLSDVVNHLLGRDPPTPFDMLVMGRFLRSSLRSILRRNALSGEAVLEVEYMPAIRQPTEAEHAEQPDWVSAVASAGKDGAFFVTGCYDGCLRVYGSDCKVASVEEAHHSPVTALCAVPSGSQSCLFLSGSKDMTARLWRASGSHSDDCTLETVSLLHGHTNSISSVFASGLAGFTGDWDGHVCIWDVADPETGMGVQSKDNAPALKETKRRKTSSGRPTSALAEQEPKAGFRAHNQVVTGLAGQNGTGEDIGEGNDNTLFSSSLDHAVKTWDVERQDCVSTVNAPKAVTCLACSSNGRMLATGHPDAHVRIWDTRSKEQTLTRASLSSHKQWISAVAWVPGSETMVASCAYDGGVKLWDIRSTLPLHSAHAHEGKALCMGWHDGKIVSGGTDGAVKTYLVPDTHT
ncbi:unnamed protein product [Choristocarpus tenellus]